MDGRLAGIVRTRLIVRSEILVWKCHLRIALPREQMPGTVVDESGLSEVFTEHRRRGGRGKTQVSVVQMAEQQPVRLEPGDRRL